MNKLLVLIALVAGSMMGSNPTAAIASNTSIFKTMSPLRNNPWDPRECSRNDNSGRSDEPITEGGIPEDQESSE